MKNTIIYICILSVLFTACHSHSHDEHGHSHEHDAHGNHIEETDEIPAVVETIWTNKTELFVEFPALIVGNESRFAAHFTILQNHKPVSEGNVTVRLMDNKTELLSNMVDAPNSIGIFLPTLQPEKAGTYQLVFEVKTPLLQDTIIIEEVRVFASEEEAKNTITEEDDNAISFLKEQAWKMEFQTIPAKEQEVFDVINTSGVWKTSPNDNATISATTNGIVHFSNGNLTAGNKLNKGQVLMTISSNELNTANLQADILKAQADLEQAQSEYERKKQLYEAKIVPKSEFEIVEQKYKITQATYNALSNGVSSGGAKSIVMPFDGYVSAVNVSNGSFVEQGASLLMVSNKKTSVLEAQVNPQLAMQLNDIQDVLYKRNANEWSSMKASNGKILSVSKKVDTESPFLSVFAEVNDAIEMPEGSFTEVQLAVGKPKNVVVIPASALLEDYGAYSVIVQLGGESFEKRFVTIGKRNGNSVEILDGLGVGEMVVTKGAYQVKMASMSGQAPAHGHAH